MAIELIYGFLTYPWKSQAEDATVSDMITSHQQRQLAFTAAQAWGADHIFSQFHHELNGAKLHVGQ